MPSSACFAAANRSFSATSGDTVCPSSPSSTLVWTSSLMEIPAPELFNPKCCRAISHRSIQDGEHNLLIPVMDGWLKRHQTNGACSWTKLVDRYERFRDLNGLYFGGDIFLAILAIVRRRHQVDPWVFQVDDARRSVFDIKRHERPFIHPFPPVKI